MSYINQKAYITNPTVYAMLDKLPGLTHSNYLSPMDNYVQVNIYSN